MAWQALLKSQCATLPIPLWQIVREEGIQCYPYRQADQIIRLLSLSEAVQSSDGFCFAFHGCFYILYNDATSDARQRFTIAHELGHCLWTRGKDASATKREDSAVIHLAPVDESQTDPDSDVEAFCNVFASRLLMPMYMLFALDISSAEEIERVFDVSRQAAQIRFERYQEMRLRQRVTGCFLSSPLERRAYERFRQSLIHHS